jgi:hypothetical protein
MTAQISSAEARGALAEVDRGRRTILDEVGIPHWYWWALALAWVGLGVMGDLAPSWATSMATFLFGAAHSAVAPRVVTGHHGTANLSVRADVVGKRIARVVLGGLVVLVGLTVALAVVAHADGARHPATIASVPVALVLVLGGPHLVAWMRPRLALPAR